MVRLVLRPGLHATRRRDASDGALRQAYHSRFPLAAETWTARNRLICRPRGSKIVVARSRDQGSAMPPVAQPAPPSALRSNRTPDLRLATRAKASGTQNVKVLRRLIQEL